MAFARTLIFVAIGSTSAKMSSLRGLSEAKTQGYSSLKDLIGYHSKGCILGDAKYSWWGKYEDCECYTNITTSNDGSGQSCDQTVEGGFKIHGGYYGGEDGTFLIEVGADALPNEMLKELYKVLQPNFKYEGLTDKGEKADRYWGKRNVPEQMRGLWWTDYNNGLTSFLHNTDTQVVASPEGGAALQSTTKVWGQNVWSWDSDTLYKIVKGTHLAYEFKFFDTCPASASTCEDNQADQYKWADITPHFTGPQWRVPTWLTHFTMRPATHCRNCAQNPQSQVTIVGAADARDDGPNSNRCIQDTCWRRETAVGASNGPSVWDYDLIKVIDAQGEKIEPHYTNWVNSLTAEVGQPISLLQRCMPTLEGQKHCAGDTDTSVDGFGGSYPWV